MPKEIPLVRPFLELGELLDGLTGAGQHTENVEPNLENGRCVSLKFTVARTSSSCDLQSCSEVGTVQR